MKKKASFLVFILILSALMLSGCFGDGTVTYQKYPTLISYAVHYGYFINTTGTGSYEKVYDCDIPELLSGSSSVTWEILYNHNFTQTTKANNELISWSIDGNGESSHKLGISAVVTSYSFYVSDLNGADALTISEIQTNHLDIYEQYTQPQYYDDTAYVDPNNLIIQNIALAELDEAASNNSFLVAKQLFIWLKQNTEYGIDPFDASTKPAIETCQSETGDCDDLSLLYISLCRAVDIPARFIRGILIEKANNEINAVPHAWAEVYIGNNIGDNGWIPVECAGTLSSQHTITDEVNQNFAIESTGHLRLYKGNGSNESMNVSMSGPGVKYTETLSVSMEAFVNVYNYQVIESKELHVNNNIRTYK